MGKVELRNRKLLVSFMTEAELEQWILLAKWGAGRVQRFQGFITGFASVPSSRDLILRWADDDGRSESEWPPHRGCRCLDCRNRVALRRCPGHAQSEGLPGCARPKGPQLCLSFDGSPSAITAGPRRFFPASWTTSNTNSAICP